MENIKTAHQLRLQQIADITSQIQQHKDQLEAMAKDDADMGDVTAGGGTKPEVQAPPIVPDPIAGFVKDARAILQGSTAPDDTQQKDLIKSLMALLAAAPAQQTAPGAESSFGPVAASKTGNKTTPH